VQDLLVKKLVHSAMGKAGIDEEPDGFTADSIERWALQELPMDAAAELMTSIRKITADGEPPVAYRINYNLREFKAPHPTDVWFAHPVHVIDTEGVLSECRVDGEPGRPKLPKPADEQKSDPCEDIEFAFGLVAMGEPNVRIQDLADWLGVSVKTAQRRLDKDGRFERANGLTWLKVV
jgi:hypothetical protein